MLGTVFFLIQIGALVYWGICKVKNKDAILLTIPLMLLFCFVDIRVIFVGNKSAKVCIACGALVLTFLLFICKKLYQLYCIRKSQNPS